MDPSLVVELGREAVLVILKVAGPILLISLTVGVVISILQALTQIQEMTISFAPKLVAILAGIIILSGYISAHLSNFSTTIWRTISTLKS